MAIDIQKIINSHFGIGLFVTVARLIPVQLGHDLAKFAADRITAHPDSDMVRAVRANQWVVSGETLSGEDLDRAVRETFLNSARSIFDLYHHLSNPAAVRRKVILSPAIEELARRPEFDRRGLMVVGLHLSNFDLASRALTLRGMQPLILTLPNPRGSQQVEFEIRKKAGMNLVTTSIGSLLQAIKYLQRGGIALTGIDRPIPSPKLRPQFFGRPANLPTHHVYLAAKAQVPVVVMATTRQPDGKNYVFVSDPIEMESHASQDVEMLRNAEKILRVGETFIQQAPQQWGMTLAVWPEAIEELKGKEDRR